jgi:hypothetical protein
MTLIEGEREELMGVVGGLRGALAQAGVEGKPWH